MTGMGPIKTLDICSEVVLRSAVCTVRVQTPQLKLRVFRHTVHKRFRSLYSFNPLAHAGVKLDYSKRMNFLGTTAL